MADGDRRDTTGAGGAAVQAVEERDLASLVSLNNAHAAELSWLDGERMATLVRRSFRARTAGGGAGFLLAFDQDADYGSPNFLWFVERHERFVYVDRVVVNPAARGRGLARALYEDLFAAAVAAGHALVTCEVNLVGPGQPGLRRLPRPARLRGGRTGRAGGERQACPLPGSPAALSGGRPEQVA